MADFYKTGGMPWVIDAVDGWLILVKASHDQEHLYVRHKSFHAMNTIQCSMYNFHHQLCKEKKM